MKTYVGTLPRGVGLPINVYRCGRCGTDWPHSGGRKKPARCPDCRRVDIFVSARRTA